uniref:Uncharacterized protein n=1 Tax=Catharus ustulatus TaxID=91951 RepID=A0A8C3VF29_CATUS
MALGTSRSVWGLLFLPAALPGTVLCQHEAHTVSPCPRAPCPRVPVSPPSGASHAGLRIPAGTCPANPPLLPAQPVPGAWPRGEPPFGTTRQLSCCASGLRKHYRGRAGAAGPGSRWVPVTLRLCGRCGWGDARKAIEFFQGLLLNAPTPGESAGEGCRHSSVCCPPFLAVLSWCRVFFLVLPLVARQGWL